MKTQANQEVNLLNPISLVGAIAGELYEQTANLGNAILDIPSDFGRGFENNLFTDTNQEVDIKPTEPSKEASTTTIQPTNDQIDAEIERLTAMKVA